MTCTFELEEGVFRNRLLGKYDLNTRNSLLEPVSIFEAPGSPEHGIGYRRIPKDARLYDQWRITTGDSRLAVAGPSWSRDYLTLPILDSVGSKRGFKAPVRRGPPGAEVMVLPEVATTFRRPMTGSSKSLIARRDHHDGVLIYYQNAGGMNSSVDEYLFAISDGCYDIIVLTETWLGSRTLSGQVFGTEYEVCRCDRGPRNSRKSTGGGVLIATKKMFKTRVLNNDDWDSVEQQWACIQLTNRKVFLCVVYVPPDRTRDTALIDTHSRSLAAVIEKANAVDEIIIIGDFNLPEISWKSSCNGFLHPDPDRSKLNVGASKLLDSYSSATLRQINYITNENGRCLDLCFVSARDVAPAISIAPVPLVKHVNHHPPLVLTLDDHCSSKMMTVAPVFYDFRNADQQSIIEFLSAIDWTAVLDERNVNNAAQTLSHILGHVIERHVPKKAFLNNKPWMTHELRVLKSTKKAALKKYSKYRTVSLRDHYKRLNSAYHLSSRLSFRRYQENLQRNLRIRPKSFWKYVNSQRKEAGFPSTMTFNEKFSCNPDDICQFFADKFASTFNNQVIPDRQIHQAACNVPLMTGSSLYRLDIDNAMIFRAASSLKSSSNSGPDGIPSVFVKRFIENLLTSLQHVFSLSLSSGEFPSVWKTAVMFPVLKKGDRRNVCNYRGITSLCAISKLFELVVMDPLLAHCKQYLSDDQHGFISVRITMLHGSCNMVRFIICIFSSTIQFLPFVE
ncbi:uncharacterized protein LOC134290552 [Aedes albopictus]|uniref:Endonuclease/exonuclease/phosphatase domain-containing protein n=1 Tax=Aedes albopictus TaxID=7160 RepID=A0ABM1Z664_AEDAL